MYAGDDEMMFIAKHAYSMKRLHVRIVMHCECAECLSSNQLSDGIKESSCIECVCNASNLLAMCCERLVPYMHVDTRRPRVLLHPCRNDVAGPGLIKGMHMEQSFLKPFAHTCPLAKMSPITIASRAHPLPASRARPLLPGELALSTRDSSL